jgi:hypothetical protein
LIHSNSRKGKTKKIKGQSKEKQTRERKRKREERERDVGKRKRKHDISGIRRRGGGERNNMTTDKTSVEFGKPQGAIESREGQSSHIDVGSISVESKQRKGKAASIYGKC